jgi:hypothetical protein
MYIGSCIMLLCREPPAAQAATDGWSPTHARHPTSPSWWPGSAPATGAGGAPNASRVSAERHSSPGERSGLPIRTSRTAADFTRRRNAGCASTGCSCGRSSAFSSAGSLWFSCSRSPRSHTPAQGPVTHRLCRPAATLRHTRTKLATTQEDGAYKSPARLGQSQTACASRLTMMIPRRLGTDQVPPQYHDTP